jgi:hypothetical protein
MGQTLSEPITQKVSKVIQMEDKVAIRNKHLVGQCITVAKEI